MDTSYIQDDFTNFTVDLSSDDIIMQESQPIITATTTELLQQPNNPTNNHIESNTENTSSIDNPANSNTAHHLAFNKNDFFFLPTIHDIVNKILTEDNSEDIGKAVEEQEDILRHEMSILEEKKKQVEKYSSLMAFDK
ncbi:unnamed protein product [Cunninghamella blakesleeana]